MLCDGIVCDGFIYKYLWDDLARFVSVAHWNYRGHGRSALPADPERIGVEDHGADLDEVRRHIGDPPVVLIGHSFGTQVCLEAYRRRPEGVRAIVFLCGSSGRITHTFKNTALLAELLPVVTDFVGRHPKLARGLWSRIPARAAVRIARLTGDVDARALRSDDLEPYFQHVAHVDFPMFLRMLSRAGEHSAEDLLPELEAPVLIVAGDKDSFTPPAISQAHGRGHPRCRAFDDPGRHARHSPRTRGARGAQDREVFGRSAAFCKSLARVIGRFVLARVRCSRSRAAASSGSRRSPSLAAAASARGRLRNLRAERTGASWPRIENRTDARRSSSTWRRGSFLFPIAGR